MTDWDLIGDNADDELTPEYFASLLDVQNTYEPIAQQPAPTQAARTPDYSYMPQLNATLPYSMPQISPPPADEEREWGQTVDSPYSKSRDLIDSTNEIHLDNFRKLQERYLNPNYQMSPTEAWAASALAILPSALGYMLGGADVGAAATQVGAKGVGSLMQNYQLADQQEREAAYKASQQEASLYNQQQATERQYKMQENTMRQQIALQEDRQAQQNQITAIQNQSREEIANAKLAAREAELEQKARRLETQGLIPGLDLYKPELGVPNQAAITKAREIYAAYGKTDAAMQRLEQVFSNPKSTVQDIRAAMGDARAARKDDIGAGAAFQKIEEGMVNAGLPGFVDPTDSSELWQAFRQAVNNGDALKTIRDTRAANRFSRAEELKAYNFTFPELNTFLRQQETPSKGGSKFDASGYSPLDQAQMTVESGLNPNALGKDGDTGLMQLRQPAVADVAKEWGMDPAQLWTQVQTNPKTNIAVGKAYREMMIRQAGSLEGGLTSYNGGIGNYQRGTVSPQAKQYTNKVLSLAAEIEKRGSKVLRGQ